MWQQGWTKVLSASRGQLPKQEGGESGSTWTREPDLNAAQVQRQVQFSCVSRVGIHRGAVRGQGQIWTVLTALDGVFCPGGPVSVRLCSRFEMNRDAVLF